MTRLFFHFRNVSATAPFRIWSSGKKNTYLKYVSSHFQTLAIELHLARFGLGASFTFELHSLLITAHTFAVVIISLHMRKCAILHKLAWLNSKKLGFTLFSLYFHKGWTAALVYDSVYSLLNSGWVYFLFQWFRTFLMHSSLCSFWNVLFLPSFWNFLFLPLLFGIVG